MIAIYFKIAIKNLLKLPGLTALKIISLALAMLTVVLISLWLKDELSFDRQSPYSERLYRLTVTVNDPEHGLHSNFARCYQTWPNSMKPEFPEIEDIIRISAIHDNIIKINEEKLVARFHEVDSSFFRIFSIPLLIGNTANVFSQKTNVVLSESMAGKLFGKSDPTGKTIQMYCQNCSEKTEYHIAGIMKDIPENMHFKMDLVGSIAPTENYSEWAYYYILLKKGSKPESLLQKLPGFFKKNKAEEEFRISKISLQPVSDIHLKSSKDRELRENGSMAGIWVFTGIAIFVLSLSLINFFNLRMAGMITNIKTAQTMKIFGARNASIMYQVTLELLVILICSLGLAIISELSIIKVFNALSGKSLNLLSIENIIFTTKVSVGIICLALITGLYPTILLFLKTRLSTVFSSGSSLFSSSLLRKGIKPTLMKNLIILQFISAIMLVSGSIVIYKQNQFLLSKRLGVNQANIVCVRHLPVQVVDKYLYFREQLLKSPLVKDVTSTFEDPADEALDKFKYETSGANDPSKDKLLYVYPAADNIFKFYRIPFLAGSDFPVYTGNDSLPDTYILNESAVATLGCTPEEAIGKSFRLIFMLENKNIFRGGKIIGVVKDFHTGSAKHTIEPTVYFQKKFWQFSCQVKIDSIHQIDAIDFIRKSWNSIYTDYPFDYVYVDDLYTNIYKQELLQQKLLSLFTVLAIFISCMGLWSISSLITRQRTKEIGVRKVNGASILNILLLMNYEFLVLVLIAFVISVPASWYIINKWLQNYSSHIAVTPWIYLFAGFLALISALITVSWQSYRAAKINPVKALRYE